jgi:hypothetical protein
MSREGRKRRSAGEDPRPGGGADPTNEGRRDRGAFPEGPGEPAKRGDPPFEAPVGGPRSRHGHVEEDARRA